MRVKDIKGYEGSYSIYEDGSILSYNKYVENLYVGPVLRKPCFLKIQKKKGHCSVMLYKEGDQKVFSLHRLLAEAFIPNPENLDCVVHKDRNPFNNNLDNLMWSRKESIPSNLSQRLAPTNTKINEETILKIKEQKAQGLTAKQISQNLSLSLSAVDKIRKNRLWTD